MFAPRSDIRIALPSKGHLAAGALALFESAGLGVYKPNPRQYQAVIPALPGLTVLFQRPGDILTSVRDGSVDFGLTGWDVFCERAAGDPDTLVLLEDLGVGRCSLQVIVPESWQSISTFADLAQMQASLPEAVRVATKFPNLTRAFFENRGCPPVEIISAEGTLEIVPTIGYADVIVDLVSTGTTLRDNRLKTLSGGLILRSQACLIANRARLAGFPHTLRTARQLLEFLVAYLRAAGNVSVFANIRGESAQAVAERLFQQKVTGGLQGPTISPVITRSSQNWFAVNIIVRKDQLAQAVAELRAIGGSGVVVTPVTYIFEEEPQACRDLDAALAGAVDERVTEPGARKGQPC